MRRSAEPARWGALGGQGRGPGRACQRCGGVANLRGSAGKRCHAKDVVRPAPVGDAVQWKTERGAHGKDSTRGRRGHTADAKYAMQCKTLPGSACKRYRAVQSKIRRACRICHALQNMRCTACKIYHALKNITCRTCKICHALQNMRCRTCKICDALQNMTCRVCETCDALQTMTCRRCRMCPVPQSMTRGAGKT